MSEGQAIDRRRLKDILDHATEGDPDYWYGVVDGFAGSLWPTLFLYQSEAKKCADNMRGTVVIVAARILEDDNGDYIEPVN